MPVTPPGHTIRSIWPVLAPQKPHPAAPKEAKARHRNSCSDGGQPARSQWGRGRQGGEAGQLDVVGSILPRVDSVARPAEVIVEYDDLSPLLPDVNKLPGSHRAGRDRACEWRLIFAAHLQTCTLRRCAALLRLRLLIDRLAGHWKTPEPPRPVCWPPPKPRPRSG